MKVALVSYVPILSEKVLKEYKRKLHYDRYYILTSKITAPDRILKKYKNISAHLCQQKQAIVRNIKEICAQAPKNMMILPYFTGEDRSRYSILVYNTMLNTKIRPSTFRLKHEMGKFLGGQIAGKKSLKLSYAQVVQKSYQEIANDIGEQFILKPVNAASSLLNFRVSSADQLQRAQKKLQKKYTYVLEEYLQGNLYSVDFFCNGADMFLLSFCREIPFTELLEKFSQKYLQKYDILQEEFLHFIPISYSIGLEKLSPTELQFLRDIQEKLRAAQYCGFVHLEYKVRRKEKRIGFIEWGARLGGKRSYFIEHMHQLRTENLPRMLVAEKDTSRFKKKNGLYFLRDRNIDRNFAFIKTNVVKKTHIMDILATIPNFLKTSFQDHLKKYLWDTWKIEIQDITLRAKPSSNYYLYPFYARSDTSFTYVLGMKEEDFERFLKKKHTILEHLVFHDYTKS